MNFDTSIPVWGIALFLLPFIITAIWSLSKMWRDQQEQKTQIQKLSEDQHTLRQLIEEKNEKTLAELKKLEQAFSMQKEYLVEMKTLLNLILSNRIRHHED